MVKRLVLAPSNGTSASGSTKACSGVIGAVLVYRGDDFVGFGFMGLAAMVEAPRKYGRCLGRFAGGLAKFTGRFQPGACLNLVLPRRWVVERTIAWLNRCRRLAKDFEETVSSATGWVLMAHIRLLTRRLARC